MVVPLVYFLFPETNGRSLEDMDTIFTSPEHWWQISPAARHLQKGGLEDIENLETKLEVTLASWATVEHKE